MPETRYAEVDGLRLAYQLFGQGPPLVLVPALLSNVEVQWEHENISRILQLLAAHTTVLVFDKRGIGLSDRPDEMPTLEQRIGDIHAVLDEVGWERASLLGVSEGGTMAQLFAADHPGRVERLVLHNTTLSRRYWARLGANVAEGDAPFDPTIDERLERLAAGWPDNTQEFVDWFMPTCADDPGFVRWAGRLQRLSASPRDFRRQVESVLALESGDAAERITCPTLVTHVQGDRVLNVAQGRVLAQVIPDARFLEHPGDSHFSWVMPHWREIVDPAIEFVTGAPVARMSSRRFATVLFTDIVDSTRRSARIGDAAWSEVIDRHDRVTRRLVDLHAGRVVKSTGDGLLVTFDAPSQGVECAREMVDALGEIGVRIRAGLHAGEIEVHEDLDISGIAVNLAARVEQAAADGEVWVSSTVRDLMLGGSTAFADRGDHALKGVDGRWRLFALAT